MNKEYQDARSGTGNHNEGQFNGSYRGSFKRSFRGGRDRGNYRGGYGRGGYLNKYGYYGSGYGSGYNSGYGSGYGSRRGKPYYSGYYGGETYRGDTFHSKEWSSTLDESIPLEENYSRSGESTPTTSLPHHNFRGHSARGKSHNGARGQGNHTADLPRMNFRDKEQYEANPGVISSSRGNGVLDVNKSPWISIFQLKDERMKHSLEKTASRLETINKELAESQRSKFNLELSLNNLERQCQKEALNIKITDEKLEEFSFL